MCGAHLPAQVPAGDLVVIGRVREPGTQHIVPLGEEVRFQQVDQQVRRQHGRPGRDPVPDGEVLLRGVDDQALAQRPCQLGQDAPQHQRLPVLGLKHLPQFAQLSAFSPLSSRFRERLFPQCPNAGISVSNAQPHALLLACNVAPFDELCRGTKVQ